MVCGQQGWIRDGRERAGTQRHQGTASYRNKKEDPQDIEWDRQERSGCRYAVCG